MWTPKRVLLLVLGIIVFTSAYAVYAHFLGRVDGLPPLPDELLIAATKDTVAPPPRTQIAVDQKLQMAFGEDCEEIRRYIKMEVGSRGLVLASNQFEIKKGGPRDGQVELTPFSIALFGKDKGDGQVPEINTIRSDVAYLTFDQPITTASDMANHKIIGAELVCRVKDDDGERGRTGRDGRVRIVNNRRTLQRDDDLVLTTPGPVFYQENLHQIWTREPIELLDLQTKPEPTTVKAIGQDVYLVTEPAENAQAKKGPARKQKTGSISGVKSIVLRSDVSMNLWVDSRSGFLGSGGPNPKGQTNAGTATLREIDKKTGKVVGSQSVDVQVPDSSAKKDAPVEKSLVVIKTQGPFVYDVLTDRARFDISQHPGPYPNNVEVRRKQQGECWDQLICDHLELQFTRKPPAKEPKGSKPAQPPAQDRGADLQIETAHAYGSQVTVTSDSECLTAIGNDLVYDARTRETTLKGSPNMIAMKDGNEIVARELVLRSADERKEDQQARARGPGRIGMLDKTTGERRIKAHFKESLTSIKEGAYDVLTLVGEAEFEDEQHGQQLQADRLKVWLEPGQAAPVSEKTAAANPTAANEAQRRRPHHIEAVGHVCAHSADMTIHDSDRLIVWFKDVPPPTIAGPVPPAADPAPAAASSATPPKEGTGTEQPKENNKKNPIDLRACSIEVHVLRCDTKNDLDKLWCEGDVHVVQAPSGPDDKGTDIKGDKLRLLHFVEGHVLTVTGDLAEVQMDKMTIFGPEVNIDQKENKAWVTGVGAMRMPSNASLQGGSKTSAEAPKKPAPDKPEKPTELTVHWNRDMFFNGKYAEFHGGVQAEQEGGRVICQTMVVHLDRFVSFKEGEKKGQPPAKVQKVLCDRSVRVEDTKYENGRLTGYQRIESPELSLDNEDSLVVAPGPGIVRTLQLGNKGDGLPGSEAKPAGPPPTTARGVAPAAEEEMKLTRITYFGRMFGNNNTRTAFFYENVEVVNVPSDNPNLAIDMDKLPEGAVFMRCDKLKVYTHKDAAGKSFQEMEARGKALVQSKEFRGRADAIKFDESKDLVILEGSETNPAICYRIKVRGGPPEEIRAKKIWVYRKTNNFKAEGVFRITGSDAK